MRLKVGLLVTVLALLFTASASATSTTIQVTSTADSTTGTCPSATTCNLRAAVAEANRLAASSDPPASVAITLASGTAYPITQGPLTVDAGLALTIAGAGATSTIDASGNGANDLIDEKADSASDSLTLSGLTITGVLASSQKALSVQGSFTATSVTFTHDAAQDGVLYANGAVTLSSDTFTADGDTGAQYIVLVQGDATLSHDSFTGDFGDPELVFYGGSSISDVTFQNDSGTVLSSQGTQPISLDNVTVLGGSVTGPYPVISLVDDGVTPSSVSGLDVEGNTSQAAAVNFYGAWSTIDDLTVAGNTVSGQDAGVALDLTGSAIAQNWTIAHNTEPAGTASPLAGGVALTGGSLALRFATVDGNSAQGDGDDLYATGSGTALSVGDSILNGSSASGAQECVTDSGATITSLGDNLDHAGTCLQAATDKDGVNPVLGALTAHPAVGSTPNIEPLGYGSPAVNAVPLSSCPAVDEDGDARPAGSLCDIGAYESPVTQFGVSVTGVPATAAAGTAVTYTVTAQNASASTPQSAVITDTLPVGAILSSASVSLAGAAPQGCSGTTTVTCPVGALRRGQQAVATITAVLQSAGTDTNTAGVSSELPDADDADDSTTTSTVVPAPANGAGSGGSTASTSTTPASTTPTNTTPATAVVSRLSLAPARFRAKTGSTLSFTDSRAGRVTLTITRTARGVRSGKQCVAATAHPAKHAVACTRALTIGSLTVTAAAGTNHLHFSPQVKGRPLAPGTYALHAGKLTVAFTILPVAKAK